MWELFTNVPTGIPAAAFAVSGNDDNIDEAIAADFVRRLSDAIVGTFDKPSLSFFGKVDFRIGFGFNCLKDDV
jgi:hypothetical protein